MAEVVADLRDRAARPSRGGDRVLRIGLVNNMPDAAFKVVERQFADLVQAAAGSRPVDLLLFTLPGVARGPAANACIEASYRPITALATAQLDAMIVTGAEPNAAVLSDGPFWPAFTALVDWAERTATPTVWSCLAAHAAVLHLDGLRRTPLARKCSGVFAVDATSIGPPPPSGSDGWLAPHSRLNTLDQTALIQSGYSVLTQAAEIGVDAFVRDASPRFLFCQGHLEYAADTLALECRRDFLRFMKGDQETPPAIPQAYFSEAVETRLLELRDLGREARTPALMANWPADLQLRHPQPAWRALGAALYADWLAVAA